MNFIKRAFYYIKEKLGKSILLFIVFLFIANLVLAGLTIQNASNSSLQETRKQLGSTVTLSGARQRGEPGSDRSAVRQEPARVTQTMAESMLSSGYVSNYNFSVETMAIAEGFEAYQDEAATTETTVENGGPGGGMMPGVGIGSMTMDATNMIEGVLNLTYQSDFQSGSNTLLEGRYITDADGTANVVVIEEQLATLNDLSVDDTIQLRSSTDSEPITYKIVGIFQASSDTSSSFPSGFAMMDASNKIYMPYQTANVLSGAEDITSFSSATFYLTDPANIEAFKTFGETTGIDLTKYTLDANDALYQRLAGSIETTGVFAKIMVYTVIIAGSIILLLIIMLSIRERQYEIGVLLALGEAKLGIIVQFITELALIFVAAALFTGITGNFVAQQVGSVLTSTSASSSTSQMGGPQGGNFQGGQMPSGGIVGMPGSEMAAEVDTSLTIQPSTSDYAMMIGAGIGIIIIATAAPALVVLRKKPKEILGQNQ